MRAIRMLSLALAVSWSLGAPVEAQSETAKLLASNGASHDFFGAGVAVSDGVVVVGAPDHDGAATDSGAVYVFVYEDGIWMEAILTASNAGAGDLFGRWVAIDGDVIVAGGRRNDEFGSDAGAAYVFEKPSGGWEDMTETAMLRASDPHSGDQFGGFTAVSDDVVVVGANQWFNGGRGAAYVFVKPECGWGSVPSPITETVKLLASDSPPDGTFGHCVAIDGDTVVVSDPRDDEVGANAGSVYVFVEPADGWASSDSPVFESAKLNSSEVAAGDFFGYHVSIDGDTIVAGMFAENNWQNETGTAYVFEKPEGGWTDGTETAILTASDATPGALFGKQVAISGDIALIGAPSGVGAAYFFDKPEGGWVTMTETAKVTASDGAAGDRFGSVGISGNVAAIGAHLDDDNGTDSGSAYVFDVSFDDACPADINGDGIVNFLDVLEVLAAWGPCE